MQFNILFSSKTKSKDDKIHKSEAYKWDKKVKLLDVLFMYKHALIYKYVNNIQKDAYCVL